MPFTINDSYTLANVLSMYGPKDKLMHIIDIFKEKRPFIEEGVWMEANGDRFHDMLEIVSRPAGKVVRINEGYDHEGVITKPKREDLGTYGSKFDLDKRLAKWQKNPAEWRAAMTREHIKGLLKGWSARVWRDNVASEPGTVSGLFVRYPSSGGKSAGVYDAVADASMSDGDRSLFVVKWGGEGLNLLYPRGGDTTFTEDDRGEVELQDPNGKSFPGYRSYFNLTYGIAIPDPAYVKRVRNILPSAIKGDDKFENLLIEVVNALPDTENTAIYCGRDVMTGIMQRINSKSNLYFTKENVWGREMPTFMGLPIVRDDELNLAEI